MGERKIWFRRRIPALVLPLALLLGAAIVPAAGADDDKRPSTPFEGFSSDSDKPVNINAEQLEMHNEDQMAIFTGNVVATQGDSVLNSDELTVYYEAADADKTDQPAPGSAPASGDAAPAAQLPADATDVDKTTQAPSPAATPAVAGPGSDAAPAAQLPADANDNASGSDQPAQVGNKVKRLLAKGHVVVTSKDQKATGDDGDLDMQTNIATLTGQEVVMSQGCNTLRGKKLVVDTKTGLSVVTGGTTGHFVSGSEATKC